MTYGSVEGIPTPLWTGSLLYSSSGLPRCIQSLVPSFPSHTDGYQSSRGTSLGTGDGGVVVEETSTMSSGGQREEWEERATEPTESTSYGP